MGLIGSHKMMVITVAILYLLLFYHIFPLLFLLAF